MPEDGNPMSDEQKSVISKRATDLARLVHLFYRDSYVFKRPRGQQWLDDLSSIHPQIARAAAEFHGGNNSKAGDIVFDLLIGAGVDFERIAAEEGKTDDLVRSLSGDPNWYARAKAESSEPQPAAKAERPPCLDGSKPLHVHEVWLGPYPAENNFEIARDWLLNKEYGGKSAAWWLSNCVTGLPFRIETFNALSGVYSIKPDHGGLVFRLLAVRRGGKFIIIWWGPKTEYNRIVSGANLVARISSMSAKPVERIPV